MIKSIRGCRGGRGQLPQRAPVAAADSPPPGRGGHCDDGGAAARVPSRPPRRRFRRRGGRDGGARVPVRSRARAEQGRRSLRVWPTCHCGPSPQTRDGPDSESVMSGPCFEEPAPAAARWRTNNLAATPAAGRDHHDDQVELAPGTRRLSTSARRPLPPRRPSVPDTRAVTSNAASRRRRHPAASGRGRRGGPEPPLYWQVTQLR